MKKIIGLIHTRFSQTGGVEKYINKLVPSLLDRGWRIHYFAAKIEQPVPEGMTVHHIPVIRGTSITRMLSFAYGARRAAKRANLPLIMAEHNRLEQVFINLVTNAIDAMDEKTSQPDVPDLEKKLRIKSFAENGQVVVYVSDTGIGMPEEVKNKIFEPFFTTIKIGKGTGLGTSISYGIVEDYDGSIELESEPGKGTTFKLSFPSLPRNVKDEDE